MSRLRQVFTSSLERKSRGNIVDVTKDSSSELCDELDFGVF